MTNANTFDPEQFQLFRILDAAINRASEGLRVVEDFARMVLSDQHLSRRLKALRHRFVEIASEFDARWLIAARDTPGDVGTTISLASEQSREFPHGLLQANFSRVQQSLRTIEEVSKTLAPNVAIQIEQARYESYTLEKAILTTLLSNQTLLHARLYALVSGGRSPEAFRFQIEQLRDSGVDLIQLRDSQLTDRELLGRGASLREVLAGSSLKWIMNNRADLAVASGADGVHLGQDDLPVSAARRIVGPGKLIGVSTHSIEQARQAVIDGANYIGVGPVFASQTKTFERLVGTELVAQVAREIALPAFAIGGIDSSKIAVIRQAGLNRIAVSNAITSSADLAKSAAEMRALLSTILP